MHPEDQAQRVADAVRHGMLANDRAVTGLGIEVVSVGPGAATLAMTVRGDMLNGFATCHGGLIATLADSAFAYACNSRNQMTVAAGLTIDFLAPAQLHDRLTAEAAEVSLAGRTGVYDVRVRNQREEAIAVFGGRSHAVRGRQAVPMPVLTPMSTSTSMSTSTPAGPSA